MVFCSVDLDCADIHGFLVARIRESPVDKRCNSGNDQKYSTDLHIFSRFFDVGIVMASIFCMGLATVRKTLSVAGCGNICLSPRECE